MSNYKYVVKEYIEGEWNAVKTFTSADEADKYYYENCSLLRQLAVVKEVK